MNAIKEDEEVLYKYVKDHYWSAFIRNTAIVSTTCRQLALGLGGLVWFDRSNTIDSCHIKTILLLLVLFFLSDAAQYLLKCSAYQTLAEDYDEKIKEGTVTNKSELVEKPHMNRAGNLLFIAKLILIGLASLLFLILLFTNH